MAVCPAKAHLFNRRPFWFCTNKLRITSAMCLTKCVTTSNKCHSLFIIHSHPAKCLTHILRTQQRIWISIRAFRVNINQTHLHRCQRIIQRLACIAIAIIIQPSCFCTPVNIFFRMPDIRASTAKTKGLATHRFNRHISSKNKQVCP